MFEDLELVLGQLADETRPVRSIDLTRLSDLPRAEAVRFDAAWADLTAARRLETVRTMVERAEANIHLKLSCHPTEVPERFRRADQEASRRRVMGR